MATPDLIDTTEMYLKTVFEMEEDGVVPMRARIVERLGHSGPTVSQTIGRMERQGLVSVRDDRRLELTEKGRGQAEAVLGKHRLAEHLLISIIGLDWPSAHEEACRWEHVMSEVVERKIADLVGHPDTDPYGNPLPGSGASRNDAEVSVDVALQSMDAESSPLLVTLSRIGEPLQAERDVLRALDGAQIHPGDDIYVQATPHGIEVWRREEDAASRRDSSGPLGPTAEKVHVAVTLDPALAPHLFVEAGNGSKTRLTV